MKNEKDDTLKKVAEYATEESKKSKKRIRKIAEIFSHICVILSVVVFSLMRQLTGDPTTKMFTDMLVIFLLVVLNVAVMVLFEFLEQKHK